MNNEVKFLKENKNILNNFNVLKKSQKSLLSKL